MTRPIRGLGPNEVDLRGMILPARATAITSATVVGCSRTAMPPSWRRCASVCVDRVVVADPVVGHAPGRQQDLVQQLGVGGRHRPRAEPPQHPRATPRR